MIGVYKIECNGKIYVGSSSRNIQKRWAQHCNDLRKGKHGNQRLQNAFNKYGENSLIFSIITIVESPKEVIIFEQLYIDELKPYYNICEFAGSSLGRKASDETKKKLHDSHIGYINTEETRIKMSKSRMGHTTSEETKRKISEANKLYFNRPEVKQAQREYNIKFGVKPPGRKNCIVSESTKQKLREHKHSDESKAKMSKARMGKPLSEETKQRMREGQAKRRAGENGTFKHSEETKQKISKSTMGRIVSEETRKKISEWNKANGKTPQNCKGVKMVEEKSAVNKE